jgi:histidyl-tRNA synthetase
MASTKPKKGSLQSVKGMHDILPGEQPLWEKLRKTARDLGEDYNFSRIDTPLIEPMALFERTAGESSDIVEKQMYVLKTKEDYSLVLRPEATASVARAYIEHGMAHVPQPVKLYYFGPLYRHEQPQEGRVRQFHQAGFEIIGGDSDPVYDAQIIAVAHRFLEEMKVAKLEIKVNSIGCKQCRPLYRKKLVDYYKSRPSCKTCKRRITVNPLRVLDCKEKECATTKAGAPAIIDSLCVGCRGHFKLVLEYLDELGLSYMLDNQLVRGLDYYSRTVFEIFAEGWDAALAGGGRYDYLLELLGAKATPAVGCAVGLERVGLALARQGVTVTAKQKPRVHFIHIGDLAKKKSLSLIESLRRGGVHVEESLGKDSLKGQLAAADKAGAELALIFGQMEAFEESIIIRDLKTGAQETVLLTKFVEAVKKRL